MLQDLTEYGTSMQDAIKTDPNLVQTLPLKLIVIQNKEIIDKLNGDRTMLEMYKGIISKFKMFRILFMFTDFENVKLPYSGVDVQKSILESRNMMILESINKIRFMDISPTVQRQFAKPLTRTEGLYYKEGAFEKYKLLV